MVWKEIIEYCNIVYNFVNRSKTKHGINCMMNALFSEIYGDRIPSLHLMHYCPQRPISRTKFIRLVKNSILMTVYTLDKSSPTLTNPAVAAIF